MAITKNSIYQFVNNLESLEEAISMGYIRSDVSFKVNKFSRTILANNTNTLLSSFNNLNPFIDTPTNLYLASDSVDDTITIKIHYVDHNRDFQEVDVTLAGTTPVDLGTDIYCIWRMYNISNTDHVGTIVVTSNDTGVPLNDSEIYCNITIINGIPNNQSLTGLFSIPRNYTGFLKRAKVSVDKGADIKGAMFVRPKGGVFRFTKALTAYQSDSNFIDLYERIDSESDIKPLGRAQTGGISFVEYSVTLIHNDYIDILMD